MDDALCLDSATMTGDTYDMAPAPDTVQDDGAETQSTSTVADENASTPTIAEVPEERRHYNENGSYWFIVSVKPSGGWTRMR